MFDLFNPLLLAFQIDFVKYIFIGFAFFGVILLVRKIVLHKGV